MTTGGSAAAVVNDQVFGVDMAAPAALVAETVAVYFVDGANEPSGANVAVFDPLS